MRSSYQGNSSFRAYKYDFCNASSKSMCFHGHQKAARPSKWDDAQKWLTRAAGDRRNPSADDWWMLPSPSGKGRRSCGSDGGGAFEHGMLVAVVADGDAKKSLSAQEEGETKRVDSMQTYAHRRVCLRDVGTEMTPSGSKEPSRTSTPRVAPPTAVPDVGALRVRAAASPGQCLGGLQGEAVDRSGGCNEGAEGPQGAAGVRPAVSPATAWDEAERARHMARYRREEMQIQAWENRERRKAELQMRRTEVKVERMRLRAQEKTARKLASMQTAAKEKRARAEATLNESAARAADNANYLRRRGHLPSSFFSLKLPLLCSRQEVNLAR